jgi:hypothetical protein
MGENCTRMAQKSSTILAVKLFDILSRTMVRYGEGAFIESFLETYGVDMQLPSCANMRILFD